MESKRTPYMLTNQNSTAFWLLDNLWMPLATSHHTQDAFSLIEQVCGTGIGGPQSHMHPTDEGMIILEGHVTFQVGGQEIKAGPGTFASIPRMTEHSFTIDTPGTRLLNFYTPGGFEALIMSLAVPAPERRAPEPGSTPMPPYWMVMETSREFGQIAAPTMPAADPPTEANRVTRPSERNTTLPYGIPIDEAAVVGSDESSISVIATAEQTGGSYSLLRYQSLTRESEAHSHEQDEAVYVLEGDISLLVEEEEFTASAGSFVYIPGGFIHTLRIGRGGAQWLAWHLPGSSRQEIERGDFTGINGEGH